MNGKEKCNLLKDIRRRMADEYGLDIRMDDCMTEGDCQGTCPKCDEELNELQQLMQAKGIDEIGMTDRIPLPQAGHDTPDNQNYTVLQGDVPAPGTYIGRTIEGLPCPPVEPPTDTPAEKKKDKVFFKECTIAGWNHYIDNDFWYELQEGVELALIRDRKNQYDKHAVAVALASDYDGDPLDFDFDFIIGYVPRTENKTIAQMMDMGWNDVFTAQITTVKDNGNFADRLRMTIYIQSKDEKESDDDRDVQIYAMKVDKNEMDQIEDSLNSKGRVYFRWGGFSPIEIDFPHEGNQVLIIHEYTHLVKLYLMYLIATDEHIAPFVDNPREELFMVDDCSPYILTNIKGPLYCSPEDIRFLEKENINQGQPEGKLSLQATEEVKDLLWQIDCDSHS